MVCALGCEPKDETKSYSSHVFQGRAFTASLRQDVLTNTLTPTPGVTLYDFHVGSRPIFFIYVGDSPGWPHFAWVPDEEIAFESSGGLSGKCRRKQTASGTSRECIFQLGDESPKLLHVWYEDLDKTTTALSETILTSLASSSD
jgi:hypothetical protein